MSGVLIPSLSLKACCHVNRDNGILSSISLAPLAGSLAAPSVSRPLDIEEGSSLCEVLGRPQRRWLDETLDAVQEAPVKLIVSGSVVFGSPLSNDTMGPCSGAR